MRKEFHRRPRRSEDFARRSRDHVVLLLVVCSPRLGHSITSDRVSIYLNTNRQVSNREWMWGEETHHHRTRLLRCSWWTHRSTRWQSVIDDLPGKFICLFVHWHARWTFHFLGTKERPATIIRVIEDDQNNHPDQSMVAISSLLGVSNGGDKGRPIIPFMAPHVRCETQKCTFDKSDFLLLFLLPRSPLLLLLFYYCGFVTNNKRDKRLSHVRCR